MTFYDKFEALCTEIGKKPREIAKEAGVKTSTLSMWKTKGVTPKYGTIKQIASILHIEWTDLVPEEDQAKVVIDHVRQAWNKRDTSEDNPSGVGSAISDFKIDGKSVDELSNQFDFSVLNMYPKEHHKAFDDGFWEGWAAKEQELQLTYGYLFSDEERALIRSFHTLNSEGQKKAIERVEELTEIPKYQKNPENK